MHEVGHHLQIEALKKKDPERDLFARSAYNRYYYSIFLMAREMLVTLNLNHEMLPHKKYPEILDGSLIRFFKREKSLASRNEDYILFSKIETAINAAKNFSEIMKKAYATRVVADYEPSEKVNFIDGGRFDLKGMSITEAHGWLDRASLWRNIIVDAWRQVHVER